MYLAMIVINNLQATIFLILSLTEYMYLCIFQLIAFLSGHKTYLKSIIIFTYLYIQHTNQASSALSVQILQDIL